VGDVRGWCGVATDDSADKPTRIASRMIDVGGEDGRGSPGSAAR
jgi:hypothetical protein